VTPEERTPHVLALARAALLRPGAPVRALPDRFALVDAAVQRLDLVEEGRVTGSWPVSTAAAGIGGAEGSLRTPPGWHRIHARIGADAVAGTVFESREPTGGTWRGEPREEDLILTRILTLEGLEEGVNRGPGCDSLERYIYVHGTNHPDRIGTPDSHGCVRMTNDDVVAFFDRVREGDLLVIVTGDASGPA
jgi:hypothetical protein